MRRFTTAAELPNPALPDTSAGSCGSSAAVEVGVSVRQLKAAIRRFVLVDVRDKERRRLVSQPPTSGHLAEWPAVVTCGRTVDEARAMLLYAAHEMLASYRDEGREPPIGGGHVGQLTIGVAAA